MGAFGSVIVAAAFAGVTWYFERTQRVSLRMSGMMLTLAGIALATFATASLLLLEESVHVLPGTLGALMIAVGAWRYRRAGALVDLMAVPDPMKHPRGH